MNVVMITANYNYQLQLPHSGISHFLPYTQAEFERVEALLKGQVRCLKTAT